MIYVSRNQLSMPKVLDPERTAKARAEISNFYEEAIRKGLWGQKRPPFERSLWLDALPALQKLFNGKCAYCESKLSSSDGAVEHFRPISNASEPDGTEDANHYMWLAYNWENLYFACERCRTNKRNLFPVEGNRANPGDPVDSERRLLIDPCQEDPFGYLQFDKYGRVSPAATVSEDVRWERARSTIEVLGLNRADLVRSRQASGDAFKVYLDSWNPESSAVRILADCSNESPFAAVKRQRLAEWLKDHGEEAAFLERYPTQSDGMHLRGLLREVEPGSKQPSRKQSKSNPASGPDRPTPRSTAKAPIAQPKEEVPFSYISRIEISNFRAIEKLDIELPAMQEHQMGWKVLLGENGAGKSTAMKAVAMALGGEDFVRSLNLDPERLLRRWTEGTMHKRAKSGYVRLSLSAGTEIEFTFNAKAITFVKGKGGMRDLIRGYGAMRLLPSRDDGTEFAAPKSKDLSNLIDPRKYLINADAWLTSKEKEFDPIGLALKDLLRLPDQQGDIHCEEEHVWIELNGSKVSLDELSDGYQSVLGLAVDIIAAVPVVTTDFRHTPGIVMIDELGTHLHPRWRMEIVKSLRGTFSSMQFLVTTHEPLCLIGMRQNEIAVLRRNGRDIEILDSGLPSPEGMRADQLLTSDFFGLHSTIDPDIDRKFQLYYAMLAATQLSDEQIQQRDNLRSQLQRYRVLGYTRRDQLVYDVIDEYLARDAQEKDPQRRRQMRDDTKAKIRDIWFRVSAPENRQ